MEDHVQDLRVLAAFDTNADAGAVRQAMQASGIADVHFAKTIEECIEKGDRLRPDAVLMGLVLSGHPTIELLRTIRHGQCAMNRFMPIVVAHHAPSARVIRMALTCGAHEVLALPASINSTKAVLYRAVFIGRPFIDCATYVGPCRRRKQIPDWGHEERRVEPWAGYVHGAHRHEANGADVVRV
jgi:PleD family two-component response regulator